MNPDSTPEEHAALIRPHWQPEFADRDYLHLSDIRDYLEQFRSDAPLHILDYGAGHSPYRALFPNAVYKRADYVDYGSIDYVTDVDGRVPEKDEQFDLVLSTQVAEHLANPACYFREALRLLKPGGRMILTTHGVWEDHGSPYDFQRWTGMGMARDLRQAGFTDIVTSKLTAGRRAYLFLWLHAFGEMEGAGSPIGRSVRRGLKWLLVRFRRVLHRWADRRWPQYRIVTLDAGHQSGPPFYIVIAAVASRPVAPAATSSGPAAP